MDQNDARSLAIAIEIAIEDWWKEWKPEGGGGVSPMYSPTSRATADLLLKVAQGIRRVWNLGPPTHPGVPALGAVNGDSDV